MPTEILQTFWQQACAANPTLPDTYQVWYFGDSQALSLELADLVLRGQKTATAGLLWSYEAEREPMPVVGEHSLVTDFEGQPMCVLQTTAVDVLPYFAVPAEFAYLEGEGDRTLEDWRDGHWRFFTRECRAMGREPSQDMLVVCEQFRLIYPLP